MDHTTATQTNHAGMATNKSIPNNDIVRMREVGRRMSEGEREATTYRRVIVVTVFVNGWFCLLRRTLFRILAALCARENEKHGIGKTRGCADCVGG